MTGISVPNNNKGTRPPKDQTPAQRYSELKQAPERYSIIQLGVALFHPVVTAENDGVAHNIHNTAAGRGYASVPPIHAVPVGGGVRDDDDDGAGNTATTAFAAAVPAPLGYSVRRYNFYMFPASNNGRGGNNDDEREVVLNPSAVAFLNQHNMSFDLWSKHGVPFTTSAKAVEALEAYIAKEKAFVAAANPVNNCLPTIQETIRRRVELRRSEDVDFHARAMASLREWLDSPIQQQQPAVMAAGDGSDDDEGAVDPLAGASFLLPPCNSFLRRALYESIEKEYPTLELESGGNQQVRVWRLNEAEKAARNRRLRRESWEDLIGTKLGVWRIFEGLRRACSGLELRRDSIVFASSYEQIDWECCLSDGMRDEEPSHHKIPLVVHNGFMDICFLLTHFHSSKLPDSYQHCKDLISDYFPIVYDTKVLATECLCWDGDDNDQNAQASNLANLFQVVVRDPMLQDRPIIDEIQVVPAVGRSNGNVEDQEHEAAFDAYMTGAIFLGLCKRIHLIAARSSHFLEVVSSLENGEARRFYARNKLYQMSMYTMDLEESRPDRDPMSRGMLPDSTFRIAGIDKAVSTRDIVRCLSGLNDESGRRVNFEIVWIDDTTFLVAASYRQTLLNGTDGAENAEDDATEDILREHGCLLLKALRDRFQHDESIVVLEDFLRAIASGSGKVDEKHQENTWMDRVLSLFGLTTKKRAAEDAEGASGKRRRLN